VTVVEVSQVANSVNEINDPEVRERFNDIEAANRLLRNLDGLPRPLKEKLSRALKGEPQAEQIQP
jgi:signal transduction protein with GAF and PtsI domain